MAERRRRNDPVEISQVFSDPLEVERVGQLMEGVSSVEGVSRLVVGQIRSGEERALYVVVDDVSLEPLISDVYNGVFPDTISKRKLPCEIVTNDDLTEIREEFHDGRKKVLTILWKK